MAGGNASGGGKGQMRSALPTSPPPPPRAPTDAPPLPPMRVFAGGQGQPHCAREGGVPDTCSRDPVRGPTPPRGSRSNLPARPHLTFPRWLTRVCAHDHVSLGTRVGGAAHGASSKCGAWLPASCRERARPGPPAGAPLLASGGRGAGGLRSRTWLPAASPATLSVPLQCHRLSARLSAGGTAGSKVWFFRWPSPSTLNEGISKVITTPCFIC